MPKILLAEDNDLNRDMLSRRLERNGFQVTLAVNGSEAVALARSAVPDLILMDMKMPIMDGYQATRQLKGDPQTHAIPVIALTAYAMAGDLEKTIQAGCDDYAVKPIDLKPLLEKIRTHLDKRAGP
jgi:two-component system, cell cycle response regulator DivK